MSEAASLQAALYITAVPLGNLRDITLRALDVLRGAHVLLCEDTRRTKALLHAHGIARGNLRSYRDERGDADAIPELLRAGHSVALVSDAGTPLIADPGYRATVAVRAAGFAVYPVPGPCAPIAALTACGLPIDRFAFYGFIPATGKARTDFLADVAATPHTVAFFDAPQRVLKTLTQLPQERPAALCRELTKFYEEFVSGTVAQVHAQLTARDGVLKGECVIVLGAAPPAPAADLTPLLLQALAEHSLSEAVRQVCAATGAPRKSVYAAALSLTSDAL